MTFWAAFALVVVVLWLDGRQTQLRERVRKLEEMERGRRLVARLGTGVGPQPILPPEPTAEELAWAREHLAEFLPRA